jgi:hypothetical protein
MPQFIKLRQNAESPRTNRYAAAESGEEITLTSGELGLIDETATA